MKENDKPQDQSPLPPDLEKQLVQTLQNLAFWMHEQSGASHIVIDLQHISDALARCSQTLISGGGMGLNLHKLAEKFEADKKELAEADPQKLANDAIERAIQAAKQKGGK